LYEEDAELLADYAKEAEGDPDEVDRVFDLVEDAIADAGEFATFGVEAIRGAWHDRFYGDVVALYINTGDTYNCTLLYDCVKDRFHVMDWGTFVETAPKYYGIY
jgi:hypothetical protein